MILAPSESRERDHAGSVSFVENGIHEQMQELEDSGLCHASALMRRRLEEGMRQKKAAEMTDASLIGCASSVSLPDAMTAVDTESRRGWYSRTVKDVRETV